MAAIHLLVPAAGVGRRFGGDRPKQYQPFIDTSLIDHSLAQLLQLEHAGPLWLGLAADDPWWPDSIWSSNEWVQTFSGGETRLHTVAAGLQQIEGEDTDWVLIHDAVRPCITPASLAGLLQAIQGAQQENLAGIAPGEPVDQAVKRLDDSGLVVEVLNRDGIWQTQTPQAFRLDAVRRSVHYCLQHELQVDDEMAALHLQGYATRLVPGSRFNIKVTRDRDMRLARQFWQLMQEID